MTAQDTSRCPSNCGFDKARNYAKFLLCSNPWHTTPSSVPAEPPYVRDHTTAVNVKAEIEFMKEIDAETTPSVSTERELLMQVLKYLRHHSDCNWPMPAGCNCGLKQVAEQIYAIIESGTEAIRTTSVSTATETNDRGRGPEPERTNVSTESES